MKLDDHTEADEKNHFIDFKFGIWLKNISEFFRKVDILQYAEFTIDIKLIDNIFMSSREGLKYNIKSTYLVVEKVKITDDDNIKYFKMLNNNFVRKINFLENYTDIFNDKLNLISNDFSLLSVRNPDSVFIYGISDTKKVGLKNDLPNIQMKNAQLKINNIIFENGIQNDIIAYYNLENKSNYSNNFLLTYGEFLNNYRIYTFNINRFTQGDTKNHTLNIQTGLDNTECEIYIVWRKHATITFEYKNNGLIIYKTY